ncbi:MAG TPA: META domain-containing protein [Gaiellaceae bacterium]|nr:META domain-containing protein [Gaiellaceae bacterium]
MDDETVTLAYTEWMLVELDGAPVDIGPDEAQPTIVLDLEESRVSGSGGVNRLTGTFALSESELRFGPLATTRMAGPEAAMQREQSFLAALERVTSYELDGTALTLLAGDDAVARLSAEQARAV